MPKQASPLALDHVALPMFAPRATRLFYRDLLGFTLVDALSGDDWGGRAWLMMIFSDAYKHQVALCAFSGPKTELDADWPIDARHYAFSATDRKALDAWKARLDAHGVAWREEDHGDQLSIYFSDPNGTVLEITIAQAPGKRHPSPEAEGVVDAWVAANR